MWTMLDEEAWQSERPLQHLADTSCLPGADGPDGDNDPEEPD
jgi:hypothetical protein